MQNEELKEVINEISEITKELKSENEKIEENTPVKLEEVLQTVDTTHPGPLYSTEELPEEIEEVQETGKPVPVRGTPMRGISFDGEKKEFGFDIVSDTKNDLVHLVFGQPLLYLSLTAEQAYDLGRRLKVHSKRIASNKRK